MKKFISRVQNLSQRAAELKATLDSAPAKVAEIRETVASTTGQLMQMRADAQSAIHGLRTDGEDRLITSLREVDEGVEVLRDAGYAVDDVEMELGVAQRLIVHLEKQEDVPHAILRQLMGAQQAKKTLHAILAALIKAEELSDRVDLERLRYHKLTVYVGLTPSVRLCWCPDVEPLETVPPPALPVATVAAAPAESAFASSNFFERREAPVPPAAAGAPATAPLGVTTSASTPVTPVQPESRDHGDPLARFKRMPDLSKFRR